MIKLLKQFLLALLLVPALSVAQEKETNYVWLPWTGSGLEATCRALWAEYDVMYNSNSIIISKPGDPNGVIAIQDMLNHPKERKFMCGISSQYTSRFLNYAPIPYDLTKIEPMISLVRAPVIWLTPLKNNSKNYKELIAYFKSLDRPINVGLSVASQQTITRYLEEVNGVKINVIYYKNITQAFPSLADGTLDLTFSNRPFDMPDKFRMLGYVSSFPQKGLGNITDLGQEVPEFKRLAQFQNISVLTTMDPAMKKLMTERLKKVLLTDSLKKSAESQHVTIDGTGQPDLDRFIRQQQDFMKKYRK
jgi:tripartite-type tricarboxylate transporter receptor subunit TctC